MKKLINPQTFISAIFIVVTITGAYFYGSQIGGAQNQDQEAVKVEELCFKKVIPVADQETQALQEWLDQHFKNKAGNDVLLEEAIKRLKQYELKLFSIMDKEFIVPRAVEPSKGGTLYSRCLDKITELHSNVRTIFKNMVMANTQVKKTTTIVRTYKGINSKLRTMLQNVAYFSGNFKTLNAKTPCYVKRCVR